MEQYIPKSVVLAEIEKAWTKEVEWMAKQGYTEYHQGLREGYANTMSLINSVVAKEIDLDKEYEEFVENDAVYRKLVNSIVGKRIAKHFFELGLKAQVNKF